MSELTLLARDYLMKELDWDNCDDRDMEEIAEHMRPMEANLFSKLGFTESQIDNMQRWRSEEMLK